MFNLTKRLLGSSISIVRVIKTPAITQAYLPYSSDKPKEELSKILHQSKRSVLEEGGPPDEIGYKRDGVRTIGLFSLKTKNVLSVAKMEFMISSLTMEIKDPNLRCIVIYAKGNVFSAGHDLKELDASAGVDKHYEVFQTAQKLMQTIVDCPVPVIAMVDGVAAAAGCQLIAQCDLAVASTRSRFSTPGVNIGIFCSTPGIPLARTMYRKQALHMLLTGLPITSAEAVQYGLINKAVPVEDLETEVNKIVDSIAMKSKDVITLGKRFFYKQVDMKLKDAYEAGGDVMVENVNLTDGKEGIRSFIEKRKPVWKHTLTKTKENPQDPYYENV